MPQTSNTGHHEFLKGDDAAILDFISSLFLLSIPPILKLLKGKTFHHSMVKPLLEDRVFFIGQY